MNSKFFPYWLMLNYLNRGWILNSRFLNTKRIKRSSFKKKTCFNFLKIWVNLGDMQYLNWKKNILNTVSKSCWSMLCGPGLWQGKSSGLTNSMAYSVSDWSLLLHSSSLPFLSSALSHSYAFTVSSFLVLCYFYYVPLSIFFIFIRSFHSSRV